MSARRDRTAILAEMGLTPVWRLRDRPPPASEAPAAAAPASVAAPAPQAAPAAAAPADARVARILAMEWAPLRETVLACTACGLHETRTQAVFGVGDESARWLLVGEAPGADEDRLGEPFVGQAGRLLDSMLAALGLARGRDVYIANVLKCRPPGNRNPAPEEVARCLPHLQRQVALIGPRLILAMGRFAVSALLGSDASIASLRGRAHRYAGVPLVVTYHPAYLLRTPGDKAKAWADLVFARRTLDAAA